MPMRQDCKFFESRSYPNGETVRKCDLDLAPEAPWRCPDDCSAYERPDGGRELVARHLVTPPTPDAAASVGSDESIGALLDPAEDIVNEAGPRVLAELEKEKSRRRSRAGGGGKAKRRKRRRRS